jgi:hypothetical protein
MEGGWKGSNWYRHIGHAEGEDKTGTESSAFSSVALLTLRRTEDREPPDSAARASQPPRAISQAAENCRVLEKTYEKFLSK